MPRFCCTLALSGHTCGAGGGRRAGGWRAALRPAVSAGSLATSSIGPLAGLLWAAQAARTPHTSRPHKHPPAKPQATARHGLAQPLRAATRCRPPVQPP
jgi:hypothetical protein